MDNKGGPKALDRTFRYFRADKHPMGDIMILLVGDLRKILPIVPRGTKSNELNV